MVTKKKILFIVDSFPTILKPSIGSFYMEQTNALRKYFDLRIIVLEARERMIFNHLTEKKYETHYDEMDRSARIPILRIKFNSIRQNRITYHLLKFKKKVIDYNFKIGCKAIEEVYLTFCQSDFIPDLILAETAQFMAPFAVFLGLKYCKPVVGYEHYPPLSQMTTIWEINDLSRPIIIDSLNKLDLILSVSQYLTNVLFLNGVKIRVLNIGNMVNENHFIIRPKSPSDFFYVTYIGYLNHLKDPITMFECIREIKNIGEKKIRFRLINGVNDFLPLIKEYQVEDVVDNLTNVSRNEVIKFICKQTDVLVSTSTSETFGLVMIEALLSGVPVIATNSGGNQEFLTSLNSIMIENKNHNKLADAIIRIKNGDIIFDRQLLRESVINKFGVEPFTCRLKKHLDEVIENY